MNLRRHITDLPTLDLETFRCNPADALDAVRPSRLVQSARGVETISYELNDALIRDQRLRTMSAGDFSSHGATEKIADFVDKGIFLFMPPERHRNIRRIFSQAFAIRRVERHREVIEDVAEARLSELIGAGGGDLVAGFTQRLSAEVLCRVIGFPPDEAPEVIEAALDLRHLVYVPMEPHVGRIEAALDVLRAYCEGLLDQRRKHPTDDFLSVLIAAEETDGRLSSEEVVWGTANLLLAGIDTTNFQLASVLSLLITNGDWNRVATGPQLARAAIEEGMRLMPVATMLSRIVAEDVEIDGVLLPAGTPVRLNTVGAGRDPERFVDPHRFSLDRPMPIFPPGFGGGIHHCIGESLAMAEMEVSLGSLTSRLQEVTVDGEPEWPQWTDAFYGPTTLPVKIGVSKLQ